MLHLFLALGNKQGDVYYVESESAGYVWINDNGTLRWELLGMTVDTSDFLTKSGLLQTTGNATNNTMSQDAITQELGLKQDTLVSGTNIKTINNQSILGSGNINIQGGEQSYSTTEQKIGTWIDGKPIYRKVINAGQPNISSNTTYQLAHNISNLKLVTAFNGLWIAGNGTVYYPMPHINGANNTAIDHADNTKIYIKTKNEGWQAHTLYIILEYTKTTD